MNRRGDNSTKGYLANFGIVKGCLLGSLTSNDDRQDNIIFVAGKGSQSQIHVIYKISINTFIAGKGSKEQQSEKSFKRDQLCVCNPDVNVLLI
jgi:hypothetical protein